MGPRMEEAPGDSLSVRLAVALAFADASIVVLALPQIIGEFNTTISAVSWVITADNVALVVAVLPIVSILRRLQPRPALLVGLGVFGLASLGCGLVGSLTPLVVLRCVQGAGGGLLLCASVPLLAQTAGSADSGVRSWAAAAAVGAAVGPAAGGLLTQVFDWRAIFLAQTPVAVAAMLAVSRSPDESPPEPALEGRATRSRGVAPSTANAALALLSAGLIGALFLVVVLLINVWRLEPLAAAVIVSTLPLATVAVERATRGRPPSTLGIAGALLVGAGLFAIGLLSHQEVALVVVALTLCGAGLGLALPTLTAAALRGRRPATVRVARTVAARHSASWWGCSC
jgi:MFS family permease